MSYPYADLREYLAELDKRGLLTTVSAPVNKDTELVPLVRLQFRGLPQEQRRGFHFTNVTDSRGRAFDGSIAIATFAASREIYDLAVGAGGAPGEGAQGVGAQGERAQDAGQPATAGAAWARALGHPIEPVLVETGPCKENVITGDALDAGGVDAFPHPVSTPGFDPAPFLTAGCWVTRDVEDGTYNVGTYRGMIKGPRKIGLQMDTPSQHIAIHLAKAKRAGRKLEVAIIVGVVPAVALSSVQKLPYGFSEYALAGGLMGRPLEVVKAETVDIDVPAHAEIVIEGYIDPEDLEPEGPFGEASGYMGPRTLSPYVHVTAITHRTAPVVQAFISEYPPSESTLMRKIGFENVYTRFLRQSCNIASVTKVTFYESASVNMIITVSLANPTAGQAWQAMYAVAGYEPSMGKIIIAVDDDIDPENLESVWWALSYRLQPHRDTKVLEGRVARLDPSAPNVVGQPAPAASSLLIDATRGGPYPPTSLPSKERMAAAEARWAELGLPPLTLQAPWFGAEFGAWDEDNREQARRAEAGDYLK
ncbi:MAG TPA: UbiD family decarboxylase [Trebonia sp.]|nr:UbiD family decarboxylase [Trebonia sp.]